MDSPGSSAAWGGATTPHPHVSPTPAPTHLSSYVRPRLSALEMPFSHSSDSTAGGACQQPKPECMDSAPGSASRLDADFYGHRKLNPPSSCVLDSECSELENAAPHLPTIDIFNATGTDLGRRIHSTADTITCAPAPGTQYDFNSEPRANPVGLGMPTRRYVDQF